jgi:PmbA protein
MSTDLLENVIRNAKSQGADAVEAVWMESREQAAGWRLGKAEEIERSENSAIGLRVFVGKKQAVTSSSDTTKEALDELVERAVAMAKASPDDPYARLAREQELAQEIPDLNLLESEDSDAKALFEQAAATEDAARHVEGITNSEGASASHSWRRKTLVTSEGFHAAHASSARSISVSVIAGKGEKMERDYDYSVARFQENLRAPESIGKQAAERTLKRLNPQKVSSATLPIVFDPRVGRSLLSSFASSINGHAIARGTSFLKECLGEKIFSSNITIMDDPLRQRGLASRPFDAEGIAAKTLTLVKDGILQSWLLDIGTAAQLELTTTGHASRSLGGTPHPSSTNLYIEPGDATPHGLVADIDQGIYITEAFGMGINTTTGDYSQGASGFWIEKGQLTHPVHEFTIAGDMREMFRQLTAANDLSFEYAANTPTLRIDAMTVAGS